MPPQSARSVQPRTAMVLGAGLGKRMRPLTDDIPKPMVSFNGKPLVDHVLDRLSGAGIARAVVNVHYQPGPLERHLKARSSPEIIVSDERDALLDTGGGVVRALPKLGNDPFVIHNSDSVWEEGVGSNLQRLFEAWDPSRMDTLLLVALASHSLGYDGHGDFTMDAEGRLRRREEGRESPFVFTGVRERACGRLLAQRSVGPRNRGRSRIRRPPRRHVDAHRNARSPDGSRKVDRR
jgi:MurNAc alpha-1-phosphate uridylyltransferase